MTRSVAREAVIVVDMPSDLAVRRLKGLMAQLDDVSAKIDALLTAAVRDGGHEAVVLHEASQAVHRALLALTPPET